MPLPQWVRIVGSFDHHSPPYQGASSDRIGSAIVFSEVLRETQRSTERIAKDQATE